MKCLLILVVLAAAVGVHGRHLPDSELDRDLYKAITTRQYANGINVINRAITYQKDRIVKPVIDRIINEHKTSVIAFALVMWSRGSIGQDYVEKYFPPEIKRICNQDAIKLVTIRDNMPLKLGGAVDNAGDRIAYGAGNDQNSENVSWKLIPVWDRTTVYFKILHVNRNQYLKLGTKTDGERDHAVFADNAGNTRRHQWFLKPVNHNGKLLFYIYNRQYNQGLKLSRTVDSDGDRRAYSNHGDVSREPHLFGWDLVSFY